MSLFDSLGQRAPNAQSNARALDNTRANARLLPQQAMQQLKSNPAAMLRQAGLNVPNGMNDPQQIINHLTQSGQLPQNRLTMAMQMAQRMGLR